METIQNERYYLIIHIGLKTFTKNSQLTHKFAEIE